MGESQYVMCEYNPNDLYTDGSSVMVSTYISGEDSEPHGWIFRILDLTGKVLLQRYINGEGVDGVEPRAICYRQGAEPADDRYAIVGHCRVCGDGDNIYKNWIVILDYKGNLVATNTVWVYGMSLLAESFNEPMDIAPVYDDPNLEGYVIAGFVGEDDYINYPYKTIPADPAMFNLSNKMGVLFRVNDAGELAGFGSRVISIPALPNNQEAWVMLNTVIEVPSEGFAFGGTGNQDHIGSLYSAGVQGAVLTGTMDYAGSTLSLSGGVSRLKINSPGVDAFLNASACDLLYSPNSGRIHFLGTGIMNDISITQNNTYTARTPYLIGSTLDGSGNVDVTNTRMYRFISQPVPGLGDEPVNFAGSRLMFANGSSNPYEVVATGLVHNNLLTYNGSQYGSVPFHFQHNAVMPSGNTAYIYPHKSVDYYSSYTSFIGPFYTRTNPFINTNTTAIVQNNPSLDLLHIGAPWLNSTTPPAQYFPMMNVVKYSNGGHACSTYVEEVETLTPGSDFENIGAINGASAALGFVNHDNGELEPTVIVDDMLFDPNAECPPASFRTFQENHSASEEPAIGRGLIINPNPAFDVVEVTNESDDAQEYVLLTIDGRLITKGRLVASGHTTLSLQGLAGGLYFIQAVLPNGAIQTTKLIKQ